MTRSLTMALALAITATALGAPGAVQGSRVSWARLNTRHPSWEVHSANDPVLSAFIRVHTRLNIDPTYHTADVASLEDLCQYPFLFTNNLANVRRESDIRNVREYLRRGGFIYIDRCVNLSFSLPQETFFQANLAFFRKLFPEASIVDFQPEHEIFDSYFVAGSLVRSRTPDGHNGIYGVYVDGRFVALLGLANFQCGWPNSGQRSQRQMEMITNIYVYAMTSRVLSAGDRPGPAQPR